MVIKPHTELNKAVSQIDYRSYDQKLEVPRRLLRRNYDASTSWTMTLSVYLLRLFKLGTVFAPWHSYSLVQVTGSHTCPSPPVKFALSDKGLRSQAPTPIFRQMAQNENSQSGPTPKKACSVVPLAKHFGDAEFLTDTVAPCHAWAVRQRLRLRPLQNSLFEGRVLSI